MKASWLPGHWLFEQHMFRGMEYTLSSDFKAFVVDSMVIPAQDGHAEVNYQAERNIDKTGDQQGRTLTPEFYWKKPLEYADRSNFTESS